MKIIEKIKDILKKIFNRKKVKALEGAKENIINNLPDKDQFLDKYKQIKEKSLSLESLTKEELIMFITFAKQEINFLENKTENEKQECNINQKELEDYQNKPETLKFIKKLERVESAIIRKTGEKPTEEEICMVMPSMQIEQLQKFNQIRNELKQNNEENEEENSSDSENNSIKEVLDLNSSIEEILKNAKQIGNKIEEKNKMLMDCIKEKLLIQEKIKIINEIINRNNPVIIE